MTFTLQTDSVSYKHKPKNNVSEIKPRIAGSAAVSITLDELERRILSGISYTPGVLSGGSKAENWKYQQIFCIDIDNEDKTAPKGEKRQSEHPLDVAEVLKRCENWDILPALIYETFSSSPEWLKFRIVFIGSEVITDGEKRDIIQLGLQEIFPECDSSCKNRDRLFFGGKNTLYKNEKAVYSFDDIAKIGNAISNVNKKPLTVSKDPGELDRLKAEFDFLGYIRATAGSREKKAGRIIQFNPCPVCGHNGDFCYYTETNSFFCFSDKGKVGGSIIDYLMHTRNMDRKAAIKHFKYDLCGLSQSEEKAKYRKNCMLQKAESNGVETDLKLEKKARKYTQLSTVDSTNTEWLWYPYIPAGKITLMTADPGTGKTFFSLYLAATVSTGKPFYGQSPCQVRPPRAAIYQTAEDGIADTIKPRLEPMQPNFENIFVIDESKEPLTLSNYEEIEQAMKDLNPALMIFDPLQAYLGADVDMHRANEVRPVLSHIGQLAEKYKCAVIFIMHNSKMGQNQALYRALGSIDIPAIARSMLILGKNPDNPDMKVVCHEKSSLAEHGKSILFQIAPESGGVVFNGFSDLKADDVLNAKKVSRDKPSVCKDEVIDCLNELIGEKGYAKLDDIKAMQEDLGCSPRTVYNAKEDLQLDSVSIGFSKQRVTYWIAPEVDRQQFKEHKEKELIDNFETLSIPPF